MVDRIIYYGPKNNGKDKELIKKSKDYVVKNKGDKFFYILPNGKLLTEYRKALLEDLKGAFNINAFTFDDIVDRLLENRYYTFVDREMKESIIWKILIDLNEEGEIVYYKDLLETEGFVKSVSSIIGEIKRSLIDSSHFNNLIPDKAFYKEIGKIYSRYERFLEENRLIDREESFFKAIEILEEDLSFFDGLDFIVIDEFFSYRPQELVLIEKIIKAPVDIYVNMPFEMEKDYITVRQTINFLKDLGFQVEKVTGTKIRTVEDIGKDLDIEVIKTPNKYLEMKRISQEIKALHYEGVELKEIGLLIPRPDEYMDTVFRVFKEEKIPCSLNEEEILINTPIVRQFLSIIDLKINNCNKKSLINRIKSSYFELCPSYKRDKIEFILRKLDFENIDDLVFIIESKKEKYQQYIDVGKIEYKDNLKFVESLEQIMSTIKKEVENIPSTGEVADFVSVSNNILDGYNVIDRIINIYNFTEDFQLFHRDITSLSNMKDILETIEAKMPLIYGNIKIEDFYYILKRYLEETTIVKTEANRNGVNILTPITASGISSKVLFVTGLVQGKYPNLQQENFFFNEYTFKPLKKIGLSLKSYEEKLDNDSLQFIMALTNCKEKLYLTYPERYSNNEENIPSMFLDEFISSIDENKVKYTNITMDYLIKEDLEDITTIEDLSKHILYKHYLGENCNEEFALLQELDSTILSEVKERSYCEKARANKTFNEYSGAIGDEKIKEDLKELQKDKKTSITYFETYGKCPYKFLLNYILNLEEMERFLEDFTPLDRGNLYHEALREYYEKYKDQIIDHIIEGVPFIVDDTLEDLENIIIRLIKNNGVEKIDNLWQMRIENMTATILNLVKKDLDRQKKYKYKIIPVAFEVEFGRKRDFKIPVDNEEIKFMGKIDRIDKVHGTDKYILYDYKTSSYGVRKVKDINGGVSFQLPIYIMAQEGLDITAAGYIIISKGEATFELVKEEEKKIVNKMRGQAILNADDRKYLMGLVLEYIEEYNKNIKMGDFSINPKECDDYCIYKDICRYEDR